MPSLGKTVGYGMRNARRSARGATRAGRWVNRRVQVIRYSGGGGELGMIRLLDLHAASCAGDTLITMGLAGTVFFSAAGDAARGNVALYLFVTMLPFALVAPVVGPVLDRFRHGRRYALAATMLGRAFLAWLISDYIHGIGLYPATIGVLLLSRAYGVARSAAVPRLLPPSLGLSEAGARASLFGTIAGAVVAPLGAAAYWFGPQWPLRVSSVIFIIGMVFALRLPPRADSEPPETVPAIFHRGTKVLAGRLIVTLVSGGAMLRALFGFLTLFLAFGVRTHHVPDTLLGHHLAGAAALAVVAGGLGVGTFLATAIGTRLRIRRPALLQAGVTLLTAAAGLLAVVNYNLLTIALFGLIAAAATGLGKLAVDATIQERIPERVRATAFGRSETVFMIAWVIGGALGLIPFGGRLGIGIAAAVMALATVRAVLRAGVLRGDKLRGASHETPDAGQDGQPGPEGYPAHGAGRDRVAGPDATVDLNADTRRVPAHPDRPARPRWRRMRSAKAERLRTAHAQDPHGQDPHAGDAHARDVNAPDAHARNAQARGATAGTGAEGHAPAGGPGSGDRTAHGRGSETSHPTRVLPRDEQPEEPGYHLYRPSGLPRTTEDD
jgi:MFS family permease